MVREICDLGRLPGVDYYQYRSEECRHDLNGQHGVISNLFSALAQLSDAVILLNVGSVANSDVDRELIYSLYDMNSRQLIRVVIPMEGSGALASIFPTFSNAYEMEQRLQSLDGVVVDHSYLLYSGQRVKDCSNSGVIHPGLDGVVLSLEDELVSSVSIGYGNLRTLVEQRALQSDYLKGQLLLEQFICTQAPIAATAWCMAVEEMHQISIPLKAQALRMLLMELARVGSHLQTISSMAHELSFLPAESLALNCEERLREIFTILGPSRFGGGGIRVGGVQLALTPQITNSLVNSVHHLRDLISKLGQLLSRSRMWISRTGCGVLDPKSALEFGITGVNLRASGLSHDQRKYGELYFYPEVDFEVPLGGEGSSYDRYLVRMAEMESSLKIVLQLLAGIPDGPMMLSDFDFNYSTSKENHQDTQELLNHFHLVTKGVSIAPGVGASLLEGADGLIGVDLVAGGENFPLGVNIITPYLSTLQLLPQLLTGMELEDVSITLASLGMINPQGAK
jgi:NADH:ubiquinone oxidoreductase subunit D